MKRLQVTGHRLQVIGIITAIILIAQSVAFADVVLRSRISGLTRTQHRILFRTCLLH